MTTVSQQDAVCTVQSLTELEAAWLTMLETRATWLVACVPDACFLVGSLSEAQQEATLRLREAGILMPAVIPILSQLTDMGKARVLATWGEEERDA